MNTEKMFEKIADMADDDTTKGVVIGAATAIIGVVTGANIANDD